MPLQRVGVVDARAGECYDMLLQNVPKSLPNAGQAPQNAPHLVNTGDAPNPDRTLPHVTSAGNGSDAPTPDGLSPVAQSLRDEGDLALAAHYDGCASWWTQVSFCGFTEQCISDKD
jgi:hypothetical protein